ncbi:recombinase family protein [Neomegalonema perideroedes]|uniref:recombinase family protein n=1 Tax=Neomegalonema perideroedes TaxID=217219 RepID=UPI0003637F86|nr:recombinase family protein [Neomegalonema perideroedes]
MRIGYARVSTAEQSLDLQRDALQAAGVAPDQVYEDRASGAAEARPGLEACLRALRSGDELVIWRLDRLGRNLSHLIETAEALAARGVVLRVLTGAGAGLDPSTPEGRLMLRLFAMLAEFEREILRERTRAGLAAARARGRKGGRRFALTAAQVRLAAAAMKSKETEPDELAKTLGVSRGTLYRYVSPDGELRDYGRRVLKI